MIQPHVGDQGDIRLKHLLGGPLQLGRNGHAFAYGYLSPLTMRCSQQGELLPDIGRGPAADLLLPAVGMQYHGQRAGRFADHPKASCTKARINETDGGGFAPDAVYLDHMKQRSPIPAGKKLFCPQIQEIQQA